MVWVAQAVHTSKILAHATGVFDYEIHAARPENGPSEVIGRVSGSRVPGDVVTAAVNFV